MKKIAFTFCYLLLFYSLNAQNITDAEKLYKKGDSLYRIKDFKNSAIAYSEAIRQAKNIVTPGKHWSAASSWSLAGFPDSAFYHLDIIAKDDRVTMEDYVEMKSDPDFNPLHADKRWQTALKLILQQAQKKEINIAANIKIKMRDGIRLNATIYKPRYQKKPLPVIFSLTPYISDTYHERGIYFSQHEYVYANIDVRGRGSSEGEFDPMINDDKDGYDIVEWLAKQPFSNGKITMWGGSYAGNDQWATAKEFPPHLKTIVPVASPKLGIDHPMLYNIGMPYISQWLTFTGAKAGNLNLFMDNQYWRSKFYERYINDIPFAYLDSLVGYPNKIWKKYIAHQTADNYYKKQNPDSVQYSKMKIPILTITGCYDGNQRGALSFYKEYMQYASPSARQNHYLIIGPWDHAGTRTPTKVQYGITMGDSSLLDMNKLHWQWYNYTMKDSLRPAFLRDKVIYYVTNRDKWKSASALEDIGREKMKLYLNTFYNRGNDKPDSTILQFNSTADSKPAFYIYNPLDKINVDNIVYNTAPLEQEIEVSGFFQLDAYIETNVKDVDISAEIFEIKSDGTRMPLTSHTVRARYRESLEKEKLLQPGEIYLIRFNHFAFISRVIEKGSRLRLVLKSPNTRYDQINYCSGGNVAYETAKDAHLATVKVHNDSKYSSVLYVPVMK